MSCHADVKTLTATKNEAVGEKPAAVQIKCQKDCERCNEKKERKVLSAVKPATLIPFLILTNCIVSLGQGTASTAKPFLSEAFNDPLLPVYILTFFVLIVVILTVVVAFITFRVLKIFIRTAEEAKAARMGVPYAPASNWWTRFWEKANALVPLEEEKSIELDHNYDGIRELDNHLPPWWKGLFYGSIVFAVVYLGLYHLSDILPLSGEEYENEIAQAEERSRILRASQPAELIDENKLTFSNDDALIASGKTAFISNNCGSCHRGDGGGNAIGPNLTDPYWLHGGDIKNVFSTIKNGAVEKGMPAWGKVMSQKQVRDLAFYILSLQGTNPPAAKKPQGELFKQNLVTPKDSTKTTSLNR